MVGEVTGPVAYEERYVWDRRTASVVIAGAVFVAVAIGVRMPIPPQIVFFAGGMLMVLWGMSRRRVALRVDADGVTLGGSPLRYRATTAVVPWADIVAIVLWKQVLSTGQLVPYLGLERQPGAESLPGPAGRPSEVMASGLVPDLPAGVLAASRPVHGWRLDRRALARTVAAFAPDVAVVDHDTGRWIAEDGA